MNNDVSQTFMSYGSNEVADLLGISESTLRKWCLALESYDYQFVRGGNNSRFFSDQDVVVLKRLKHLVKDLKRTVNDGAEVVLSMISEEQRTKTVRDEKLSDEQGLTTFATRSEYQQIIERLDKQEEFNKLLLEQLKEQQRYIDDSLKRRDEQLMLAIRQSLETQRQLAIAETVEKEQAKSWWKRLFKK